MVKFTTKDNTFVVRDQNERVQIPIAFWHKYRRPVTLSLVEKSCGCLDVRLPEGPVAPETESQLTVKSSAGVGTTSRQLVIGIRDTAGNKSTQTISFEYSSLLKANWFPKRIIHRWDETNESRIDLTLQVHARRGETISFCWSKLPEELASRGEPVLRETVPVFGDFERREYQLALFTRPVPFPLQRTGTLYVTVGDWDLTCPIAYDWLIGSNVYMSNSSYDFGRVPVGSTVKWRCLMVARAGTLSEIRGLESSSDEFTAETLEDPDGQGRCRVIEVSFTPKKKAKSTAVIEPRMGEAGRPLKNLTIHVKGEGG